MNKEKVKAVFFDMDGVLLDSMKNHASAWVEVMRGLGLNMSEKEAYMNEGRTASSTINIIFNRELGRYATEEEIAKIYEEKTRLFNLLPEAEPIDSVYELLLRVKNEGKKIVLVTGSGQKSLLDKLDKHFPDMFSKELMITAYDVVYGKPNPEPYLKAIEKSGVKSDEAIVIENAPLGIESSHKAGIFTVAVNTGPLEDSVLMNAGANAVYSDMSELIKVWDSGEMFSLEKLK